MTGYVDADGVKLAVDVVGEGDPVSVVAHGLTGTRQQLAIFAPYIPGTKILFDFRGHGDSDRPPAGQYTMDHFASDVDAVAREYGATAVIGASLGGGAALRLLMRDPHRFEKLVVLLPARLELDDPDSARARERILEIASILERHELADAAERLLAIEEADHAFGGLAGTRDVRREAVLAMNSDGIPHAIRGSIDDPPVRDYDALRRITARTLVVGQGNDHVHAASVARDLAEMLPNGELLLYDTPQDLLAAIPEVVAKVSALLRAA